MMKMLFTIGAALIFGGMVSVLLGILLMHTKTTGGSPTLRSQAAQSEPFGLHMTEEKIAVLWAIPFKTWTTDDAQYGRITETDLVQEENDIARLRLWVATLPEGDVKQAYIGWSDVFERWIAEARHELATHDLARADAEERDRRDAILATLPKPVMQ